MMQDPVLQKPHLYIHHLNKLQCVTSNYDHRLGISLSYSAQSSLLVSVSSASVKFSFALLCIILCLLVLNLNFVFTLSVQEPGIALISSKFKTKHHHFINLVLIFKLLVTLLRVVCKKALQCISQYFLKAAEITTEAM